MSKITIPLGASVRIVREDNSIENYVFRGTDQRGAIFEDSQGIQHIDVLSNNYLSVEVTLTQ